MNVTILSTCLLNSKSRMIHANNRHVQCDQAVQYVYHIILFVCVCFILSYNYVVTTKSYLKILSQLVFLSFPAVQPQHCLSICENELCNSQSKLNCFNTGGVHFTASFVQFCRTAPPRPAPPRPAPPRPAPLRPAPLRPAPPRFAPPRPAPHRPVFNLWMDLCISET